VEMPNCPYSKEMLYTGYQRTFKSDASKVAFLLGGIGTGNVSIVALNTYPLSNFLIGGNLYEEIRIF